MVFRLCGRDAGSHEVESGTAISVWAAALGEGEATPFHSTV